jgi:hypothetical protein
MSYTPQSAWNNTQTGLTKNPGPFLGEIMSNVDPMNSGRLLVYIPDMGGDPEQPSSWHVCRYMSPFYGIQPLSNSLASEGESEQIQSYGMWMNPPDIGVKVLIMFINGDRSRGVWIGCLPEIGSHAAIPGQDAGDFDIYKEYGAADLTSIERPAHSTSETFVTQGIDKDQNRGPVTSSSLRESPSNVFGFNTPGSHSFVMDDGNVEGTSKLVRLRSGAGNQIMMNDDNGFIYIINANGSGWVEISPAGNIDVYGEGGINLATKGSVNIHAEKDINMHANENIKMVAKKGAKLEGSDTLKLHSKKLWLNGVDSINQHSCGDIKLTGEKGIGVLSKSSVMMKGACFKWNSGNVPAAESVTPETTQQISGYDTTTKRAPAHEPWSGHDSETAIDQTPDDAVTDIAGNSIPTPPASTNTRTTALPSVFNNIAQKAQTVSATDEQIVNRQKAIANDVSLGVNELVNNLGNTLDIDLSPKNVSLGQFGKISNLPDLISSSPLKSIDVFKDLDPTKALGEFTGSGASLASQALSGLTTQGPASLVPTNQGPNNIPFSPAGSPDCSVPISNSNSGGTAPNGGLPGTGDTAPETILDSNGEISVPGNPDAQRLIQYARSRWKNKPNRELWIAAMLAQVATETDWFRLGTEQGSDSYFERYEGSKTLGNTQPGDGKRFRGRGWIQLTGRYNYSQAAKALGVDIISNPDRAADKSIADKTAVWYFEWRVFGNLNDPSNVDRVSYLVNGGDHGLARRRNEWAKLSAQLT